MDQYQALVRRAKLEYESIGRKTTQKVLTIMAITAELYFGAFARFLQKPNKLVTIRAKDEEAREKVQLKMAMGRKTFSKKSMTDLKAIYLKLLDLKFKAS